MSKDFQGDLLKRFLAANRQSANELVDEWAGIHGYERAVTELFEPVLQLFGEKWSKAENISLAQGYIVGKIAEDIMQKAANARAIESSVPIEPKGPVVIGNIEDDYHSLGRKMVVTFLHMSGWKVYDLGNDVLAPEFVDKAVEVGAKVVGASAMMYTNAVNIKKLRQEIDRRGLTGHLQLAVGGAVFVLRPELVEEVGGDGTARNAFVVADLMRELWNRAIRGEK